MAKICQCFFLNNAFVYVCLIIHVKCEIRTVAANPVVQIFMHDLFWLRESGQCLEFSLTNHFFSAMFYSEDRTV